MHSDFSIVWLIPLFPLIGFVLNGLAGPKIGRPGAGWLAFLMMALSFIVACIVFSKVQADPTQHIATLMSWMTVPSAAGVPALVINWEALVDPLTCLMLLIITGVGGLIHLYSIGYMAADRGFSRFFTYLNLFVFFMLLLVMGNNMVMMFVGWEGVGLCSYLLIGFYYDRNSAASAALKAMVVNRVGDVGVLIAMFLGFKWFGTLDFYTGAAGVPGILEQSHNLAGTALMASPAIAAGISTIALMIFWGCTGKSAQIPLYTWLPDAMEGPTPVSALIHAATMVTAGVYLVSRLHNLFGLSQIAMTTVATIGMATAFFAATMALVQNDIKRILAYSTMSQLGYMFAACGVGAYEAGMFHVMTHAFFKACLFLGSGIVIHGMEHAIHERHEKDNHEHSAEIAVGGPNPDDPQDTRNMGGLRAKMPITHLSMLLATFAIAGIPLFSGFFSKDEILSEDAGQYVWIWGLGVITSAMTAFYMMRLMYKTYYGSPKTEDAKHASESGMSMLLPVGALGLLALIGGYTGLPPVIDSSNAFLHSFYSFLGPAVGNLPDRKPIIFNEDELISISSVIAILFVSVSYFGYKSKDGKDLIIPASEKSSNRAYQFLLNKYKVDEAYHVIFTVGGRALANFISKTLDIGLVDGLVNGTAWIVGQVGASLRTLQTGFVRNYAFSMLLGVLFVIIACFMGYHHVTLR